MVEAARHTPPAAPRLSGALRRDALLLGTDMCKDPETLVAADDDRVGVTVRFDLNLLARSAANSAAI